MTDLIAFLQTPLGAILSGAAILTIALGYFKIGISERTKGILKLVGVLLIGYGLLSYMNIPITSDQGLPGSVIGSFNVVGSESHSYVVVNQDERVFTWTTAYDHSGDAIVGATQATFSFSISRGLGTVGLVQTSASVVSVPSVFNSTTETSSPLIRKTGNQYDAIWTRADSTSGVGSVTITIGSDSDGTTVSLNLTLGQAGVKSMNLYEIQSVRIEVAGQPWAINVLLTGG